MDYSSAEMTCILKINTQCQGCKVKVMQVLRNIRGVYNVTIDGEQGTVKVTGRVNPRTLLSVLEKYEKHAEVKYVKFDGEIVEKRRSPYYGDCCGYAPPYGTMECSYPSLVYPPQHQCYQPCVPPPPPPLLHPRPRPPYPPPPPCHPPPVSLFPSGPPPPIWPPPTRPYGPPPLAPEWPPPPPPPRNPAPRGETSGSNRQNECTVM